MIICSLPKRNIIRKDFFEQLTLSGLYIIYDQDGVKYRFGGISKIMDVCRFYVYNQLNFSK